MSLLGIFSNFLPATNNSKLSNAIDEQDLEKVMLLLISGKCSVNGNDWNRDPPLIQCVISQYKSAQGEGDSRRCEILKLLVHHGANVDVQSQWRSWWNQMTAAMIAASLGYLRCLQFLVKSGADLTITNDYRQTILMLAVEREEAYCVKYLTEHMPQAMIDYRSGGETALMLAAPESSERSLLCMQHLIDAGAELDLQNKYGYTAVMLALNNNSSNAVSLLLEKGAALDTVKHTGHTPLTVCSSQETIKLLRYGLDPTLSRRDQYCLHYMVAVGSKAVIRGLVMNGFPALDLDCRRFATLGLPFRFTFLPSTRISPLAVALLSLRPDVARYLIANHFFTRFDITRLSSKRKIWRSLQGACNNENSVDYFRAKQCLEILNFLSKQPKSLRTLCLIVISSALSQDFAIDLPHTLRGKDKWICKPTFIERLELLEIPGFLKRALLHQTPLSGICCRSWEEILLEKNRNFPFVVVDIAMIRDL